MCCCCNTSSDNKVLKNKTAEPKEIPKISEKVNNISKVNMAKDSKSKKSKSNTSLTKEEKKKNKSLSKEEKKQNKLMAKEEKRRSKEEKERLKSLAKEEKKKQKSEKDNKKNKSKSSKDNGGTHLETKASKASKASKNAKASEMGSLIDIGRSERGKAIPVPKRETYPFLPSRFEMPRGHKGYVFPVTPGPARYPVTRINYPIMKVRNQRDLTKKMIAGPSSPAYTMGIRHTEFREFYNKIQ